MYGCFVEVAYGEDRLGSSGTRIHDEAAGDFQQQSLQQHPVQQQEPVHGEPGVEGEWLIHTLTGNLREEWKKIFLSERQRLKLLLQLEKQAFF